MWAPHPPPETVPSERREKFKVGHSVDTSTVVFNRLLFKGVCVLGGGVLWEDYVPISAPSWSSPCIHQSCIWNKYTQQRERALCKEYVSRHILPLCEPPPPPLPRQITNGGTSAGGAVNQGKAKQCRAANEVAGEGPRWAAFILSLITEVGKSASAKAWLLYSSRLFRCLCFT